MASATKEAPRPRTPPTPEEAPPIPPHKQRTLAALALAIEEMRLFEKDIPTFAHEARGIVRNIEEIARKVNRLPVG